MAADDAEQEGGIVGMSAGRSIAESEMPREMVPVVGMERPAYGPHILPF